MKLTLLRLTQLNSIVQRGALLLNGTPFCVTLERPWLDNLPSISCIPEGEYPLKERTQVMTLGGMDLGRTYEIENVPDRSGILFHPGNGINDTHGCVLLGSEFDIAEERILESRKAFGNFLAALNGESDITLRVAKWRE